MIRTLLPRLAFAVLAVALWAGAGERLPQEPPLPQYFYYPYYYFPHSYWPQNSPTWPEPKGHPYVRPPAYQALRHSRNRASATNSGPRCATTAVVTSGWTSFNRNSKDRKATWPFCLYCFLSPVSVRMHLLEVFGDLSHHDVPAAIVARRHGGVALRAVERSPLRNCSMRFRSAGKTLSAESGNDTGVLHFSQGHVESMLDDFDEVVVMPEGTTPLPVQRGQSHVELREDRSADEFTLVRQLVEKLRQLVFNHWRRFAISCLFSSFFLSFAMNLPS